MYNSFSNLLLFIVLLFPQIIFLKALLFIYLFLVSCSVNKLKREKTRSRVFYLLDEPSMNFSNQINDGSSEEQ